VGLAGCSVLGSDSSDLTVAHMPIFPDLQYFVMDDQGYFDDTDRTVNGKEFTATIARLRAIDVKQTDNSPYHTPPRPDQQWLACHETDSPLVWLQSGSG